MIFFNARGNKIQGQQWLRLFVPSYFLGGPTYRKLARKLQSSPLVEAEICALLRVNLTEYDLKRIMAWKIAEIDQHGSDEAQRIIYRNNWMDTLADHRYGHKYADSILTLAREMPQILQQINAKRPQDVFEMHQKLHRFGPTYILTILFFVTGGQQPIYDRFAHVAALAIHQGLPPDSDVSYRPVKNWNEYEDYKRLLLPIVHACGQPPGDMIVPRSIDQALWVYGHLFNVPKTQAKDRHGTKRRAASQASHEGEGGQRLWPVATEHYEVARSLNSERSDRTFTPAEFKRRYRETYPNRNPTSIMPAGYSVPSSPSDKSYPKFLRKTNGGYVFTGTLHRLP